MKNITSEKSLVFIFQKSIKLKEVYNDGNN